MDVYDKNPFYELNLTFLQKRTDDIPGGILQNGVRNSQWSKCKFNALKEGYFSLREKISLSEWVGVLPLYKVVKKLQEISFIVYVFYLETRHSLQKASSATS